MRKRDMNWHVIYSSDAWACLFHTFHAYQRSYCFESDRKNTSKFECVRIGSKAECIPQTLEGRLQFPSGLAFAKARVQCAMQQPNQNPIPAPAMLQIFTASTMAACTILE